MRCAFFAWPFEDPVPAQWTVVPAPPYSFTSESTAPPKAAVTASRWLRLRTAGAATGPPEGLLALGVVPQVEPGPVRDPGQRCPEGVTAGLEHWPHRVVAVIGEHTHRPVPEHPGESPDQARVVEGDAPR